MLSIIINKILSFTGKKAAKSTSLHLAELFTNYLEQNPLNVTCEQVGDNTNPQNSRIARFTLLPEFKHELPIEQLSLITRYDLASDNLDHEIALQVINHEYIIDSSSARGLKIIDNLITTINHWNKIQRRRIDKSILNNQEGESYYDQLRVSPIELGMALNLNLCAFNIIKYIARYKVKTGKMI